MPVFTTRGGTSVIFDTLFPGASPTNLAPKAPKDTTFVFTAAAALGGFTNVFDYNGTTPKVRARPLDVFQYDGAKWIWRGSLNKVATSAESDVGTSLELAPSVKYFTDVTNALKNILARWDGLDGSPVDESDPPATRIIKTTWSGAYDETEKRWTLIDGSQTARDNNALRWANQAIDWSSFAMAIDMEQNTENWGTAIYWGTEVASPTRIQDIRSGTTGSGYAMHINENTPVDAGHSEFGFFAVNKSDRNGAALVGSVVTKYNGALDPSASRANYFRIPESGRMKIFVLQVDQKLELYVNNLLYLVWDLTHVQATAGTGPYFGIMGDSGTTSKLAYLYSIFIGSPSVATVARNLSPGPLPSAFWRELNKQIVHRSTIDGHPIAQPDNDSMEITLPRFATPAEARSGTANTSVMNPARTADAIASRVQNEVTSHVRSTNLAVPSVADVADNLIIDTGIDIGSTINNDDYVFVNVDIGNAGCFCFSFSGYQWNNKMNSVVGGARTTDSRYAIASYNTIGSYYLFRSSTGDLLILRNTGTAAVNINYITVKVIHR